MTGKFKFSKEFLLASMFNRCYRLADAVEKLSLLADHLGQDDEVHFRVKRENSNGDMGVT